MKNLFSKKTPSQQEGFLRTYLDRIAPGVVKFEVDHYIFGSTYRCVWALREYPASTEAQALLRELGEKSGVTLRIYCRQVSPGEEDRIIDNANKKNKLDGSDPNKLRQAVAAESNLRDVAELVHKMHREHEPLVHCAVYPRHPSEAFPLFGKCGTDLRSVPCCPYSQGSSVLLPNFSSDVCRPRSCRRTIPCTRRFGIRRTHPL